MLALISPAERLYPSWSQAASEWPAGSHQDGTGLRLAPDPIDHAAFAAWVRRLRQHADHLLPVPDGEVHTAFLWIVSGDTYVGAIDVRHYLNDVLAEAGGHIGYSVRPSRRGMGTATWALQAALPIARRLGLDRVLLTCDPNNEASRQTIVRNGGIFEGTRETTLGVKQRYWISLLQIPIDG